MSSHQHDQQPLPAGVLVQLHPALSVHLTTAAHLASSQGGGQAHVGIKAPSPSITTSPKEARREHVSSTSASSASADAEQKDDYPRPAAPTPGHVEHHEHHGFETYGKRPEHVALPHGSKPSSEAVASPMTPAEHGSHGRIAQPQGKQLNV
ncbi:hypothetical protein EXIGLDRAFT_833090 [Exidia glandulosa HHB12029]|uniref:Uncharacterized protein n=1 Tax=Exidia glandulosa HHB12029 TaxID=1314781 RepID=A0A165KYJ3_EXIGL|nr:hypothetical protein EXIGLDRAFT_833090 [Exidia glandulosa HHB12029]